MYGMTYPSKPSQAKFWRDYMKTLEPMSKKDGLEGLFFQKLRLYAVSWDGTIPIKEVNRKFSLMFLTKDQTRLVLDVLESRGLVEIKKTEVVLK